MGLIKEGTELCRRARQQNGCEGSRVEDLTIWEMVKDVILEVPAEAWEELPKDGSRNVDHYLYGAPKREP